MVVDIFIFSSKYAQRMRRLSCKIFNDFYIPEISKKQYEYGKEHASVHKWQIKWYNDFRNWERNQEKPIDLDPVRNWKYYPAHPQLRELTGVLRDIGLYRDEHRDFNEQMKQVAISRGKVFRERRGPISKKEKKK